MGVNSPILLMGVPRKLKDVFPAICLSYPYYCLSYLLINNYPIPNISHLLIIFVYKVILTVLYILPIYLFHILYFISCFDLQVHVNATNLGTLDFLYTVVFLTTRMMGGTIGT